ncbi:hypothetical protein [Streptomyces sp. LN245]|uniref:hypothetical protein n=1 Tax=Streptomyces sp. LN245 TaxID=3112975 RepID=UPI0037241F4B
MANPTTSIPATAEAVVTARAVPRAVSAMASGSTISMVRVRSRPPPGIGERTPSAIGAKRA